jgi:hypothetical protein
MTTELFRRHYSTAFKKMVIEEYLATRCSKMSLLKKYGIPFKSAIQKWMRTLGYPDPYASEFQIDRKATFERQTYNCMPSKSSTDSSDPKMLQKKIAELEKALEDEKLRSEAYQRMIEKAERELNIVIRKKPFTK